MNNRLTNSNGRWEGYFRSGPFSLPDFAALDSDLFSLAFADAIEEHTKEINAIAESDAPPTFENTLAAMEACGVQLSRVSRAFFALTGAHTSKQIQAVERAIAPILARHAASIALNESLFARITELYESHLAEGSRFTRLTGEDARLLERTYTGFVRGGARLKGADRDRLAEIDTRLSSLGTQFAQNVLADERDWQMVVEEDGLAGLPTFAVSAMAEAARERGLDGHVLTLSRSIIVPFLTFADRRDPREVAFRAWTARGETGGETDNRAIMAEILQLRAEKARLLGYASFAAYKLEDQMAKTPDAVRTLLQAVWTKATARAGEDAVALQALAAAGGDDATIAPWDWRYLAQKRRAALYAIDEAVVKPFFQLERMIEAAFAVAGRLFGLRFEPLPDLVAWHPDVRAWRVTDGSGRERGLFLGDYFARSSKRSGAWMSALRGQHKLGEGQTPVIYNVMNFAKPAAGQAALLSLDDAHTLFHEFGHALHGLLSDVTWPSLAGTSVARDWVELPSQLFEHWLTVPEVLAKHAVHADTGEPLPQELMDKLLAARTFDSGFDTVEYAASALVDLAFHETAEAPADPLAREAEVLAELGMPAAIVMRHRSPHFAHIFSGDGYAAGYYSYLWSEVLDADAFEAFGEAGDAFHPETADKLLRHVYAAGNSQDAGSLYTLFRGRMPTIDALMRKRGLAS